MPRNYILQLEEVEFNCTAAEDLENGVYVDTVQPIDFDPTSVDLTGTTLKIGEDKFFYAGDGDGAIYFTVDGEMPPTNPEVEYEKDNATFTNLATDWYINTTRVNSSEFISGASYTLPVYLYTGEDDPTPTSNFSKNVTHNDHAYNAVDRIRRKLQAKADEGGIGGGSKDWSITTTTKTVAENVDGVVDDDATKCLFKVYVDDGPSYLPLSEIKVSAVVSTQINNQVDVSNLTERFVYYVSDNEYKRAPSTNAYSFLLKGISSDDQGYYIQFLAKPLVLPGTTVTMLSANCTVEYENADVTLSEDFAKVLQYVIATSGN